MIASRSSSVAGSRRGYPRGVAVVSAGRVAEARGESRMASLIARGARIADASTGGSASTERTSAGRLGARGSHHHPHQRRVREGHFPTGG